MNAAIYIAIGVGGASILLMIIFGITIALLRRQVAGLENAVTELCHKDFESNTRIDDVERKLARTVGWVEGLTGKTIKGVEVK